MPRVISYTPPWLSRPEPGFQLFASTSGSLSSPSGEDGYSNYVPTGATIGSTKHYQGSKRIVAHRGTEIFVVADNQIRWSDLCMLKDDYEDAGTTRHKHHDGGSPISGMPAHGGLAEAPGAGSYRVLQASIPEPIRQLSISPTGSLLAIVTSHTVHIALLPNPSMLGQKDRKPIKLNLTMLARTIHVLSQSPIASILWHPCGVNGSCLVTVTADAVVRLWELDFKDHMSFDSPSLGIDLKKLGVGILATDDFAPNPLNASRAYSLALVGMDVASACFGGRNSSDESPWCAMTLWVAMKGGDIYALCPLLPSKWQPSSTMLPSIAAEVVSNHATMQDSLLTHDKRQQIKDQYQWMSELDSQQPLSAQGGTGFVPGGEIYYRPLHPGSVPKLQGPFQVLEEDDGIDLDLCDIHVIAAKVDTDELMNGEDFNTDSALGLEDDDGLSMSIVCLMARNGRVHICLDLDGVQAQWLPTKRIMLSASENAQSLLNVEVLASLTYEEEKGTEWPTFSPDVRSRYSFFVTHSDGVYYMSCEPWIQILEAELESDTFIGTAFRMESLAKGPGTLRQKLLDFESHEDVMKPDPTAAVVLQNSEIGYFLLTVVNGTPRAVVMDRPDGAIESEFGIANDDILAQMALFASARCPYVPSAALWKNSSLPQFLSNHVPNRHKKSMKEELRLSSATLDLMTRAHRVLSEETYTLGVAAADLFRRCERLQDELKDQISQVGEIVERVDEVVENGNEETPNGEAPNEETVSKETPEMRLEKVQQRQEKINRRFEELSKKVRKHYYNQPLNDQELAFAAEIDKLNHSVVEPDDYDSDDNERHSSLWYRLINARELAKEMLVKAHEIADYAQPNGELGPNVPPELRKEAVDQVMSLLERESALVKATWSRLENLNLLRLWYSD